MPKLEEAEKKAAKPIVDKGGGTVQRPTVTVHKSITKNLGDYNSMHIEIGATIPVNPSDEDLKNVKLSINILSDLVDEEMEAQLLDLDKVRPRKS